MNSEAFKHIRPEDKGNLEAVVNLFKEANLKVYLGGSSLSSDTYNDIDLVVQTFPLLPKDIVIEPIIKKIESVLGAKVCINPCSQYDETTYMGSTIVTRYSLELGNTKIDIVDTNEPFGFVPSTPREEL